MWSIQWLHFLIQASSQPKQKTTREISERIKVAPCVSNLFTSSLVRRVTRSGHPLWHSSVSWHHLPILFRLEAIGKCLELINPLEKRIQRTRKISKRCLLKKWHRIGSSSNRSVDLLIREEIYEQNPDSGGCSVLFLLPRPPLVISLTTVCKGQRDNGPERPSRAVDHMLILPSPQWQVCLANGLSVTVITEYL